MSGATGKNAAVEELQALAKKDHRTIEVADAIARIIAQPAGERPLHTVVAIPAQRQSSEAINAATTEATHSLLDVFNLLPLVTLTPKDEA